MYSVSTRRERHFLGADFGPPLFWMPPQSKGRTDVRPYGLGIVFPFKD